MQRIFIVIVFVVLMTAAALAQTTAFNYQGKLNDGPNPANGNYQLQFRLFDAVSSGGQIGSTITNVAAAVNQGVFSVKLDFGASVFAGANRFLEIAVRRNSGESYVTLSPREQIASSPYSIRTLSAANADVATNAANADSLSGACVGCVTNNHINSVDGAKVTGTVASAMNAINANNATNAVNFSGALNGDVTGNQTATTVAKLRSVPLPAPVVADNGKVLKYKNNGVDPITLEWATDNTAPGGGGVTSVTASGPLASSGGATPNISLTGVVPAANGGTGVNAAGAAGNLLRSNGTAWTSAALQAADVPDLGASYLKNTTAPQAPANFNISGNGIIGGNVGIGTTNPQAKLDVNGTVQIASGGSGGQVVFAAPNGESGMLISGTSRADIRFDGSSLKLLAGVSTGAPISTNGIAITTTGNVGIGTTNPTTKLHVLTSVPGASAVTGESPSGPGVYGKSPSSRGVFGESTSGRGVFGQSGSGEGVLGVSTSSAGVSGGSTSGSGVYGESAVVNSLAAAGVYGKATGSGGIGVIGESNVANAVGVFGVSTSPAGVAVYARNNSGGRAIVAEGDVVQTLSTNGLVKAMLLVNADGTINLCYNSQLSGSAATTPPCGFSVNHPSSGAYDITFPFQVNTRFFSATVADNLSAGDAIAVRPYAPQGVRVTSFYASGSFVNAPFYLMVF